MNSSSRNAPDDILRFHHYPTLSEGVLVLAFEGWMDGGDVSTGTVRGLVDLLGADPFAEIDPEPFYIYNFPGSMEIAAMFRPAIEVKDGLIDSIEMPQNTFYCHESGNLVLFTGKEPNMRWRTFADAIFTFCQQLSIKRILFVGSFGGTVPHTRQPRLFITCSSSRLCDEMEPYGVRRSGYEGPGAFTSYLMTRVQAHNLEMVSLVAEIPGYLQGTNPMSLEAVARRLAKILNLSIDLDSLRAASTAWELQVSSAVEENDELAEQVRALEEEYDNDLLEQDQDEA